MASKLYREIEWKSADCRCHLFDIDFWSHSTFFYDCAGTCVLYKSYLTNTVKLICRSTSISPLEALREPADIGVSLCESEYISPPSATPVHVTAKISFVRHVSLFPAAAS